ncbi:hypothetical protein C1645_817210 [Glomus cerebriforme]|uniref:HMG box domain-containing protein n=1 Tax=Glomus cerebriforme TaxID=658196 RepID=A0A397TB31_9GLOM|nr:hypothetical protein C1645_817210 [Glomus cerebriforme]
MRLNHEAEINTLSKQLNLNPEFIKNIMKYQREHAPRKKRKISAYNVFQTDWWEIKKPDGYNLSTANIQKMCSDDWKNLDKEDCQTYQEKANEISNNQELNSTKYIENAKSRLVVLNKGIHDVRKIFGTLQIMCGIEFITLAVSNRNELQCNYFGTNTGEEFYRKSSKFQDFITPFRSLSIVKHNEYIGIFDKVEKSFVQNKDSLLKISDKKNVESSFIP